MSVQTFLLKSRRHYQAVLPVRRHIAKSSQIADIFKKNCVYAHTSLVLLRYKHAGMYYKIKPKHRVFKLPKRTHNQAKSPYEDVNITNLSDDIVFDSKTSDLCSVIHHNHRRPQGKKDLDQPMPNLA